MHSRKTKEVEKADQFLCLREGFLAAMLLTRALL
jgi:hypothetical protein